MRDCRMTWLGAGQVASLFLPHKTEVVDELKQIVQQEFGEMMHQEVNTMRSAKLGLRHWENELEEDLWTPLFTVLQGLDWTIFWRNLSLLSPVLHQGPGSEGEIWSVLREAAYEDLSPEKRDALTSWVRYQGTTQGIYNVVATGVAMAGKGGAGCCN